VVKINGIALGTAPCQAVPRTGLLLAVPCCIQPLYLTCALLCEETGLRLCLPLPQPHFCGELHRDGSRARVCAVWAYRDSLGELILFAGTGDRTSDTKVGAVNKGAPDGRPFDYTGGGAPQVM
jgi:hypothetical protein